MLCKDYQVTICPYIALKGIFILFTLDNFNAINDILLTVYGEEKLYKREKNEKIIDELLKKMTLSEKIGQLHQVGPSPVGGFEISPDDAEKMLSAGKITKEKYDSIINHTMLDAREDEIRAGRIGSFIGIDDADTANHLQQIAVEESRLGIPIIFGMDVIHGHKTIFPIPLAEACSFNAELFKATAETAAREAAEDGINWTFAPMVDIARDARWGRCAEGAGEDTYLATVFAKSKVEGFQGNDFSDRKHIAACIKHFAAYGAAEGGRDYNTVDMSKAKFLETYFPPYAAGIKAGAATVMAAFNDLSGVPCTTNKYLLKTLLRDKLGFDGFVISDANGIEECVNHGTALNSEDAARQAIEAGCDMDLGANSYINFLEKLVKSGDVSERNIDESVRNILRIKLALGLFEQPYAVKPEKPSALSSEHRSAALKAAHESVVLLENENKTLPLCKTERIAVVGNVAAERDEMHGTWVCSDVKNTAVSLIDALKKRNADYTFAPCFNVKKEDMKHPFLGAGEIGRLNEEELYKTIADRDTVIAALSYHGAGEANSRCDISLQGDQLKMLDILKKSGKKVIAVLFNGRPLALGNIKGKCDALIEAWHLGTEAGNAVADIIFGDFNPSGRLAASFPHYSGECPIYYNHPNTGRPADEEVRWTSKYRDAPVNALYPFGYGLSYCEYIYSNLKLSVETDTLVASVEVKNSGEYDGTETVQLYIHRRSAERVRPVRELKGFCRVYLKPGESKRVTLSVSREQAGYFNTEGELVTDKSLFDVWMAHDSSCGEHGEIMF